MNHSKEQSVGMNSRQHQWGGRKMTTPNPLKRKRQRADDEDIYDEEVPGHPKVRCVGNQIYFNCAVDDSSIGELVRIIEQKNFEFKMIRSHELVQDIEPAPLYLHLNTDGGSIFSAMWAVDTILTSTVPIYTVVNGRAASAGSIISVVGKKRFMTKHSYMLIHQLSSGVIGKYNDIKQEYQNCNRLMENMYEIYTQNSKLSKEQVKDLLNGDHYWNLETCVEYGLVDGEWQGEEKPQEITLEQLMELTDRMKQKTEGESEAKTDKSKCSETETDMNTNKAAKTKRRRRC